ncbi:MAG: hypothetical protein NXI13_12955 [Proteobacteria bacterium]|nr:hypothetical protein [Pseudomonadota bacterium]
MYKESFLLTARLFPVVSVTIVAAMASLLLDRLEIHWIAEAITNLLVWTTLYFIAYFFVIFPSKNYSQITFKSLFGFMQRYFGLYALCALPALPFLLPEIEAIADGNQNALDGMAEAYFYLILLFILLIVFSLLGTYLPAFVSGKNEGLKKAFDRGKRSFFRVAGLLIIGPFAVSIVSAVIYWVVLILLELPECYFLEDWTPNYFVLLISLPFFWFQAWSVVMGAWIISKTFLGIEEVDAEELSKQV